MPEVTSSLLGMVWDFIKVLGLMFMGLIFWKGNTANAMDKQVVDHGHIADGVKHLGDATGVGVGAVAAGDAVGIISWLDLVNPIMQTGIMVLTLIWMIYRIIEIRVNIKAKNDAN